MVLSMLACRRRYSMEGSPMTDLPSGKVKDALAACEKLRMLGGPMISDAADREINLIENLLRYLLNIFVEQSHVVNHHN